MFFWWVWGVFFEVWVFLGGFWMFFLRFGCLFFFACIYFWLWLFLEIFGVFFGWRIFWRCFCLLVVWECILFNSR